MTLVCPVGHCMHSGDLADVKPIARALGWGNEQRILCPFCRRVMVEATPETVNAANHERRLRSIVASMFLVPLGALVLVAGLAFAGYLVWQIATALD